MTSLALSIVLQAAVVAATPQAAPAHYARAYHQSVETGQPLVVLVGADWCPGCQTMKTSVVPQLRRRGALTRVAFAHVNTDRQRTLARQLMSGSSIPQLWMFYRTANGWQRRQLTGAHSVAAVESCLDECVRNTHFAKQLAADESAE
jgi:thioredoxin-like negative regulator of GroEL